MGETAQILALWHRALAHGERVCLATVVHVEGSSYRKPGARMLLTAGGERAGTISGGCLEAEVSRKAWWLTTNGPTVQAYQSSFDEDGGGAGWGLGCGGTVWVLLEQQPDAVLRALEALVTLGTPAVVATQLAPPAGTLGVLTEPAQGAAGTDSKWRTAACTALREQRTIALDPDLVELRLPIDGLPPYLIEYLAAPPRLTIFGAGDDAQPIARFAETLGWRVAVADGRSHLLRRERFPEAAELRLLAYPPAEPDARALPRAAACGLGASAAQTTQQSAENIVSGADPDVAPGVDPGVAPGELAVILTHSFEQDRALLAALLPLPLTYLGILGPRHRTLRLLEEVAPALGWTEQQCLARLHSPVGLDLGARDPAAIALSIVADLQAVLAGRRVDVRRSHPASTPAAPLRTDRHG